MNCFQSAKISTYIIIRSISCIPIRIFVHGYGQLPTNSSSCIHPGNALSYMELQETTNLLTNVATENVIPNV